MKTVIKILVIIVALFIIILAIAPVFFKGRIVEIIENEANKNLNATVSLSDVSISFLRNFPYLYTGIHDIVITGIDNFENDTLLSIDKIGLKLNLLDQLKGKYSIHSLYIRQADANLVVNEMGQSNWDIVPESGSGEAAADESAGFSLELKKIKITNSSLIYNDSTSNVYIILDGLEHELSGNFNADRTNLKTSTLVSSSNFEIDGTSYASGIQLALDAIIDADLKNEIYTFKKNVLRLNDLQLNFDGSMGMAGDDPNFMLTFNTPGNDIKEFLSLIPELYKRDFENIKTEGKLALNGFIKGIYKEEQYPSFGLDLDVSSGKFKYPDFPQAVSDIAVVASVKNQGGSLDNTVVDVNKLAFSMAGNPFIAKLHLATPVSDPFIRSSINGTVDLDKMDQIVPLAEGEEVSGRVEANMSLEGKLSDIENERYQNFKALGSLLVNNLIYKTVLTAEPVLINHAQLNFAPSYIDLVDLDIKSGGSDIRASGKFQNYLAYFLKDDKLKGTLNLNSEMLDIDELLAVPDSNGEDEEESGDMQVFVVPENIDFAINTQVEELKYQGINIKDVTGDVIVKDRRIDLQGLDMNLLGGAMAINGSYETWDAERPLVDLVLDMKKINISEAAGNLFFLEHYAPFAKKIIGNFDGSLSFASLLNENMEPLLSSLNGEGKLNTTKLNVKGVNTTNAISDYLKLDNFKDFNSSVINIAFKILEGIVNVKPTNFKVGEMDMSLTGWTSFDKEMAYNLDMAVPRSVFGAGANSVLDGLVDKANLGGTGFKFGETVKVTALIGGTIDKPKLNFSLSETGQGIVEDLKKKGQEELQKKQEEAREKAEAEAQKIIDEAEKQAQAILNEAQKQSNLLMENARKLSAEGLAEADKQALILVEEAKKQGVLAEAAAKIAADQLKEEAKNQADNIIKEAQNQSDKIMNKARGEAGKVRDDARVRADKIR